LQYRLAWRAIFKGKMVSSGVFDYWDAHGRPPQCKKVGSNDFECSSLCGSSEGQLKQEVVIDQQCCEKDSEVADGKIERPHRQCLVVWLAHHLYSVV
jgi:hypothetical protein